MANQASTPLEQWWRHAPDCRRMLLKEIGCWQLYLFRPADGDAWVGQCWGNSFAIHLHIWAWKWYCLKEVRREKSPSRGITMFREGTGHNPWSTSFHRCKIIPRVYPSWLSGIATTGIRRRKIQTTIHKTPRINEAHQCIVTKAKYIALAKKQHIVNTKATTFTLFEGNARWSLHCTIIGPNNLEWINKL